MFEILRGRTALHTDGDYAIVASSLKQHAGTYYRVVSTVTGDQSLLMSWSECLAVIEHAKAGKLLGSFDC